MGKGARNRTAHAMTKQQAMDLLAQQDIRKEFDKQVGIELRKRADEFYEAELAMIIWSIRKTYGFGEKRLRDWYNNYRPLSVELAKWYGENYSDVPSVAEELLKRDGINFREWEAEDGKGKH